MLFRFRVAYFAEANTADRTAWMARCEEEQLRRKWQKLKPQTLVWAPSKCGKPDPVMGTEEFQRVSSRNHFHPDDFGDQLNAADYKKWMDVNHACKILEIKREDVAAMTQDEVHRWYQLYIDRNPLLSREGHVQASIAAEKLVDYISTDLFRRETKDHFVKFMANERKILNTSVNNVWNEKFSHIAYLFALHFFGGSIALVYMFYQMNVIQNRHMQKRTDRLIERTEKRFFDFWLIRKAQKEVEKKEDPPRSKNVYVDEAITGKRTLKDTSPKVLIGHVETGSVDPLYEKMVQYEAEQLFQEEQRIADLIARKE